MAGVAEPIDYEIFQNHGYQGLYGGLGAKDIHQRKGLKKSHNILDFMGSTELAETYLEPHRQMRNYDVTMYKVSQMQIEHIMKSVQKYVKQLKNLAG